MSSGVAKKIISKSSHIFLSLIISIFLSLNFFNCIILFVSFGEENLYGLKI